MPQQQPGHPPQPLYADRARAESFGGVASDYDRYRPSYPDALIQDLVALRPRRTLDVACGTGKAAVSLVACGLAVLGVEVDPKMADVARGHGVLVEVSAFESWDDDGRRFDLLTCGQAWHWIDPEKGPRKAAELLNPGGTLALFWNRGQPGEEVAAALDEAYRTHAPELAHRTVDEDRAHAGVLSATGLFASVETETYAWQRSVSAAEWVGQAATHSDHLRLPDERRRALLDAVRDAIDAHGGVVDVRFGTLATFARTPQ